ncbi:MAG TPA: hypothetical protein VHM19_03940 [Polyangiales bacterium]|nr:hypothetical protein [Polyangiales bacterium]
MPENTLATCPKHNLQYNRTHYLECELCRRAKGAGNETLPAAPSRAFALGLRIAGSLITLAVLVASAFVFSRLQQSHRAFNRSINFNASLDCERACAKRAEDRFDLCAQPLEAGCADSSLALLEDCAERCEPELHFPNGIGYIAGGPGSIPQGMIDYDYGGARGHWPDRAYLRLKIARSDGHVLAVYSHNTPPEAEGGMNAAFMSTRYPPYPFVPRPDAERWDQDPDSYVVYAVVKSSR